ncbi:MAG: hypothetical protein GYA21_00305 [Myxococcales bacterium]|nr:hypothetical protein [Myxococcales bacterium]
MSSSRLVFFCLIVFAAFAASTWPGCQSGAPCHEPDWEWNTDWDWWKAPPVCVNPTGTDPCSYEHALCRDGEWACEDPKSGVWRRVELEKWAYGCGLYNEVFGCHPTLYYTEPKPDWQDEGTYTPPDPATLTGEWSLITEPDDIVPLGCNTYSGAQFQAFAINPRNPDVMYLGMDMEETSSRSAVAGVYKSVDGGKTWFAAWAGLGGSGCGWCRYAVTVRDIYVDPDDSQLVFVDTEQRGQYLSDDGGAHWTALKASCASLSESYVRKGRNGFHYSSCSGSLFRSSDSGETWENLGIVSPHREIRALVPDPVLPDRVWLGMGQPFEPPSNAPLILVSDDAGSTWREAGHQLLALVTKTPGVIDLDVCPAEPQQMAAAVTGGGIFLSDDGGETWRPGGGPVSGDLRFYRANAAYAPLPAGCLLFASLSDKPGTYWTEDGGATWEVFREDNLDHLTFNPYLPRMVFGLSGFVYSFGSQGLWLRM